MILVSKKALAKKGEERILKSLKDYYETGKINDKDLCFSLSGKDILIELFESDESNILCLKNSSNLEIKVHINIKGERSFKIAYDA